MTSIEVTYVALHNKSSIICAPQYLAPTTGFPLAFWIMPGAAEKRPASPTDRNVPHARPACEVVDRAGRAGNARFSTKVNGANHLSRIGAIVTCAVDGRVTSLADPAEGAELSLLGWT